MEDIDKRGREAMMGDSLDLAVNNTVEIPTAAARMLACIPELYAQSKPINTVQLLDELHEAFWWGTELGSPEEELQTWQRLRARGWALEALRALTPEPPYGLYRLEIVLTTLLILSDTDREAMAAVPPETACPPLIEGLVTLLKAMKTRTQSRRGHFSDLQQEETLAAGSLVDYRQLGRLIRNSHTELPPAVHLAVLLLKRFTPEKLAGHIEDRQDIFFSDAVRKALAGDAPKFALLVNDVPFKFVCASMLRDIQVSNAAEGSVDTIRELLLQVAQTDHWQKWLLDFAQYPHPDTVAEQALSEALLYLTPAHWSAFVNAVELWTYAGTARPVANILAPFLHAMGNEKSADMWRFAFERWSKWDYDSSDSTKHLVAPSTCSFDFPVAVYYSLQPLDDTLAEEARLLECIATVEQKWFTDFSELVSYRNRLSSRLRLVQHGLTLRKSSPRRASWLPPPVKPDSDFAKVRYRFYDTSSRGG
ncbi:hypothetical protein ACQ4WQ_17760 [Janthinobacterium sp. GB1R12]|uniref:hypothetical protein n=1 Tax=Janthinobacterium sp. GB1R12 TaxID=3424190 RepID=UPI003F2255C1